MHTVRLLPFRLRQGGLRANDWSLRLQTGHPGSKMYHLYRSQQDINAYRLLLSRHDTADTDVLQRAGMLFGRPMFGDRWPALRLSVVLSIGHTVRAGLR